MKILSVEAHLFYADGRTDVYDEAKSRFSKFCELAYKCSFYAFGRILWTRHWPTSRTGRHEHTGTLTYARTLLDIFDVQVTVHRDNVYNKTNQMHLFLKFILGTGTELRPDPARKLSANIYHCCVYSEKLLTMDRGTVRNM